MRLAQYSVIGWLQRFPHWGLSVRFLPRTPPAPGEAAYRVAAEVEGKNPDKKVR